MSIILSTEKLGQKERFSYWNDVVTQVYAPCNGTTEDFSGFNASVTVNSFGSTELSTVSSQSVHYHRRDTDLHTKPQEDIFISIMHEGNCFFTQNDRQVRHQKGDVLIYDSAKPYVFSYPEAYQSILLRLPRAMVQTKVSKIDSLGGTVLEGNSPYARLINSLMKETSFITENSESHDFDEFITPTLEMITSAVGKGTDRLLISGGSSHEVLLNEIKCFIRNNITNEELSLEMIAKHKNMSLRTLSRLFAEAGETPKSWLQEQRLSHAYSALMNRKVKNVTEAALTYGYKDLSHFSRAFKQRYGCNANSLLN